MNRRLCFAAIVLLALLAGGASTWEGSAVVGGANDFPGEGLYAACNSFPRDASVEVRNLENGKAVTVVVTKNVDNPGVFIALSPKAAAELGMRQGAAARVRATTLSLSKTEASLPAARAGETADPDFNPKVYVERDKSASAKAAAPAAAAATAPEAVPAPAPAPAAALAAAPLPPAEAPAEPSPAPSPEPAAEIIAQASAPKPAAPSAAAPAEPAAEAAVQEKQALSAEAKPAAKPVADPYPLPELASASPGEPRPDMLALELPKPEAAPIPVTKGSPPARSFPASRPELVGGSVPKPKAEAMARVYLPEPSERAEPSAPALEAQAGEASPGAPAAEESASLYELARPALPGSREEAGLSEPELVFAPDELPEELLPRLAGPKPELPDMALDEIVISEELAAGAEAGGPQALSLERPAREESVAEIGEDEPELALLESAGPEALAAERPQGEASALALLADPNPPRPSESLAAEPPVREASAGQAELEEPAYIEYAQEQGPAAVAVEVPARGEGSEAELGEPAAPLPAESLGVDRPAEGPASGEGEVVVALEPTAPRPPEAAPAPASAPIAQAPAQPKPEPAEPAAAPAAQPSPSAPVAAAPAAKPVPGKPLAPPASVPVLVSLARGSYYVQIGVYGTSDSLDGAVKGFRSTYPLAVEKIVAKGGRDAYRLYIGPLSRDESGTILYRIKSMGYRDAFVKQGS